MSVREELQADCCARRVGATRSDRPPGGAGRRPTSTKRSSAAAAVGDDRIRGIDAGGESTPESLDPQALAAQRRSSGSTRGLPERASRRPATRSRRRTHEPLARHHGGALGSSPPRAPCAVEESDGRHDPDPATDPRPPHPAAAGMSVASRSGPSWAWPSGSSGSSPCVGRTRSDRAGRPRRRRRPVGDDPGQTEAALDAALAPLEAGAITVTSPRGTLTLGYDDVARTVDVPAMVAAAASEGRGGSRSTR